jgi:protein-disulfide isomerase
MTSTLFRNCFLGFCCTSGWYAQVHAQPVACSQPLQKNQEQTVIDYVRKKYKLSNTIALTLKKDTAVRDTCFRELTFEGKSAFKAWELTLYASPDTRFLTSDLFDTSVDPVVEQRIKDAVIMKGLVQGASAQRGPENAAVTIVAFSDFQCPFCRGFAQILNETLLSGEDDVRVVFHHMPLAMHPWARTAAEAAGCAQLQSNEAFWSLHDRIFENQKAITAGNAKEKLGELAKNSKGVDAMAFQKCIDTGMSVGLVMKDMDLAETNRVNGTPTIFINGHRIQGVESAAKLHELISAARKESGESNGVNSTRRDPGSSNPSHR